MWMGKWVEAGRSMEVAFGFGAKEVTQPFHAWDSCGFVRSVGEGEAGAKGEDGGEGAR